MRLRFCLLIILCFVYHAGISAMEAEEQQFRDELKSDSSAPRVSHEKYQSDLAKLLEPKLVQDFNFGRVLFLLSALALGVVVIFFIKQIRMNLISEVHDEVSEEVTVDHVKTEKAALVRADNAAASNDFRSALRYLYLSALLHLQERGILPYDKSLTNREYLHQSQIDMQLQKSLGPAITVFDEVWYGYKPCDAETVANYRDILQKVYVKH